MYNITLNLTGNIDTGIHPNLLINNVGNAALLYVTSYIQPVTIKNSVNNYALIDTVVTHPNHKVQGYANETYFE